MCLDPAARTWLLAQPAVRAVAADPFVSLSGLPPPPPPPPSLRPPWRARRAAHTAAAPDAWWYPLHRPPHRHGGGGGGRQLQGGAAGSAVQADAEWPLRRINARAKPAKAYAYSLTGAGVDVYVLDSGVNALHDEFVGRVRPGANMSPDQAPGDTDDCHGHGTHVAALAVGSTWGAGKQALLIPVRVYDCSAAGPLSQGLAGINFVLSRMASSGKRSVINMSFGTTRSDVLDAAVAELVAAGGVVVVAAGNERADACGDSPAGSPAALAVAASKPDDDFAAKFSNHGPCVALIAPGAQIKSAWVGGPRATKTLSGTSAASPLAAGVAAQVLQANPAAPPRDVAATLTCSASRGQVGRLPSSSSASLSSSSSESAEHATPNLLLYTPPGGFPGGACVPDDGTSGGGGADASWAAPRARHAGRHAVAAAAVAGAVLGRAGRATGRGDRGARAWRAEL